MMRIVILLTLTIHTFFGCCSEVIKWRYYSFDKSAKRLETGNWFQLEYVNKSEWRSKSLNWSFKNEWCEILNSSSSDTSGRCNLHGDYEIGVKNASSITERRIFVINFSNLLYRWNAKAYVTKSDSAINVSISIWIAEGKEEFMTEHSKRLSQLLFSYGEKPILEVRSVLKSSLLLEVDGSLFYPSTSNWKVSFQIPVENKCIFVKIQSTSPYSIFDKSVRDTMHMVNTDIVERHEQDPSALLKSSISKLVKNQCSPTHSAFLSSDGVFLTTDSWQNSLTPFPSDNLTSDVIDNLAFSGNNILLLLNGNLAIFNQQLKLVDSNNGLHNITVKSVCVPESCHEDVSWRNVVVVLSSSNLLNSSSWLYVSFNNGMMFQPVTCPSWSELIGTNATIKDVFILDSKMHGVNSIIRIMIKINFNSSKSQTFLVDYCYADNKWENVFLLDKDGVQRFDFLLSTSIATLVWSEKIIVEIQGNETAIVWNSTLTEKQIKNIFTDQNGRFVIELKSNELYTGMIGVANIAKISSTIKSENSLHGILDFDAFGHLSLAELFLNGTTARVIFKEYPLFAEIDSVTRGQNCKIVSFSHNIQRGWYEMDIGHSVQLRLVIVSKASHAANPKVIESKGDGLDVSITESLRNLGKYTEMTTLLNISATTIPSIHGLKEKSTSLVLYYSNVTLRCFSLVPRTAFFKLQCPASSELVISNATSCNESKNLSKYCASAITNQLVTIKVLLKNAQPTQTFIPRLSFQEESNRQDFTVTEPSFQEITNLPGSNFVEYQIVFQAAGSYHLKFTTNSTQSFCDLQASLEMTVQSKISISNAIYIIVSVCLGISLSFILLLISFLLYRYRTIEEHRKEAEVMKRQQELRFLTNLQDFKDSMNNKMQRGRRRSSVIKEGLKPRNLPAISEKE